MVEEKIKFDVSERTEVSTKQIKQEEKQNKKIGSVVPHNGHKVFKIHLETGEISFAKFMKTDFIFGQDPLKTKSKLFIEEGYTYVSAMNEKNARKKFLKGDSGFKYATK